MRPLVYIAGKISGNVSEYVENLRNMMLWGDRVEKLGCDVFVPGTDFLIGVVAGGWDYSRYFRNSQGVLLRSDAMFVTPDWETSAGTAQEITRAEAEGIPVFYGPMNLLSWIIRRENEQ